jgi:integrase
MLATTGNEHLQLVPYRGKLALAVGRGKYRRRISTGTNDAGLARVIAQQIWQKLHAPASERVSDLWKLYLADRRKDGRDVTRQENAWKRLQPVFGDRLGTDVNKDDCRDYAALRVRQGASLGTAKIELEYLRACLNLRYGRGNNHVWTPQASAPRDRFLTREEVDTLLAHVSTPHVRLFIVLAITTGARMGAILELRWDDVDFKHGVINFNPPGREQTNKRRPVVPMTDRARESLEEAVRGALTDYVVEWDGKPLRSIKKAIRMASVRSGIACSPHVFRHTAGVWMAQADVPMQKIAQFLGHTSTRVTERTYARYSPSFMKDAAAALEF